jgi:uncharacterized protein YjbI with pentapeptide repeats
MTEPDAAAAAERAESKTLATFEDLQREKLAHECTKLEIEVERLRREKSTGQLPLYLSAAGSLGAVFGLALSAYAQFNQLHFQKSQFARQDKLELRQAFQLATQMATDPSGGAERQISGIYQLRPFWGQEDFELATAATLASLLVSPNSGRGLSFVRCSAAEVLGKALSTTLPPPAEMSDLDRTEQQRQKRLARMLYGNRSGEQGLVAKLNHLLSHGSEGLLDNAKVSLAKRTPEDNINCTSAVGATVEAIRKNWENLRSANLQSTDLSYAELYAADLNGSALMNARLVGANLRCANLAGANLTGFDPHNQPMVELANVHDLRGSGSAAFRRYALANGAVEIPDEQWLKWRKSDFNPDVLTAVLKPGQRVIARQAGSLCGPYWSRSTQSADRAGQ